MCQTSTIPVRFHEEGIREPVPFPWEKLTGKPLVYASMGSLLNGSPQVFKTILESVVGLPEIEVVLSVGNKINIDDLGPIPSNTIVVPHAPQLELLNRAQLCITHAGFEHNSRSVSTRSANGGDPLWDLISQESPHALRIMVWESSSAWMKLLRRSGWKV